MFSAGQLPIIVDALDEGRILSVEHFESFLISTVKYVAAGLASSHPKVVFFGRPEAIELSLLLVEDTNSRLTTEVIELEYFDQEAGTELIVLSAAEEIRYREQIDDTIDRRISSLSSDPCRELIDAYFDAIESALTIDREELWKTEYGRAFAGYAPVLVAIGVAIGNTRNYYEIKNRIAKQSTRYAWDVIDDVLSFILDREKDKLQNTLRQSRVTPVPSNAYDRDEQLTYLTQRLSNRDLTITERVRFGNPGHRLTYSEQVRIIVDDHPFVRGGEMANDVLGSAILSYALSSGQEIENRSLFKRLYRQPFLWRHIQRDIGAQTLLDGNDLGSLLSSCWNDPLVIGRPYTVRIEDSEENTARVEIKVGPRRTGRGHRALFCGDRTTCCVR